MEILPFKQQSRLNCFLWLQRLRVDFGKTAPWSSRPRLLLDDGVKMSALSFHLRVSHHTTIARWWQIIWVKSSAIVVWSSKYIFTSSLCKWQNAIDDGRKFPSLKVHRKRTTNTGFYRVTACRPTVHKHCLLCEKNDHHQTLHWLWLPFFPHSTHKIWYKLKHSK